MRVRTLDAERSVTPDTLAALGCDLEVPGVVAANPTSLTVGRHHLRCLGQWFATKLHRARASRADAWFTVSSCSRHRFLSVI